MRDVSPHIMCIAKRVFAFASHGVFSGPANERITESVLDEVVVANTIPLNEDTIQNPKIVHVRFQCAAVLVLRVGSFSRSIMTSFWLSNIVTL